jgi:hypothetical protein
MVGLDAESVQKDANPHALWAQRIQRDILQISLNLVGPKDQTTHRGLVFLSAAIVSLDDLEERRAGIKDAVHIQVLSRRQDDRIPVAFLTYADGIAVDLSTVTFSFDIRRPLPFPSGTSFEVAVAHLRRLAPPNQISVD